MKPRIALASSVLFICSFFVPFTRAQVYSVTDLGTLGGYYSGGTAINDLGQVVGFSDISDHSAVHAFRWTKQAGMRDLNPGAEINPWSYAAGINNLGQVVGAAPFLVPPDDTCFERCYQTHAFLWTRAKGMRDLGTLGTYSAATGTNIFGQIAGSTAVTGGNALDPFLWSQRKGMQDLGNLGGDGVAQAINDFGQVVGGSFTGDAFHAFSWTKSGGMEDLGTLCGYGGQASGVNDLDQVVGIDYCDVAHAFRWTKEKGMQDLGIPPGLSSVEATGINIFGVVVGTACGQPCVGSRGVLWTDETGWLDLNNLIRADSGWVIENVSAINFRGQITGQGFINGQYHAFLLTPNFRATQR